MGSYGRYTGASMADLIGLTLLKIEGAVGDDELRLTSSDGRVFVQYHSQDCCENVQIEDICGDLEDLIGAPLVEAECVTSENETPEGIPAVEYPESYTWTFYKFRTIKGGVTVRWLGESNGYYSEDVDMRVEPF